MNKTWFVALMGLILTGALGLAQAGFAQPWGPGTGRRGQGNRVWVQGGQGPGNLNCPNYPGYRNCPQGWRNNPQVAGPRGRRSFNPSGPQGQLILPETPQ